MIRFFAALLGAGLLVSPAFAQHHGGGHGGSHGSYAGGYQGGYHSGYQSGYYGGGYHSGYYGGYHGGYRAGYPYAYSHYGYHNRYPRGWTGWRTYQWYAPWNCYIYWSDVDQCWYYIDASGYYVPMVSG